MTAREIFTQWPARLHDFPHFSHQIRVVLHKFRLLEHEPLPLLLRDIPEALNRIEGAAVWRQEALNDPVVEVSFHRRRSVNTEVVHVHVRLALDLAHELGYEVGEGGRVVARL